MAEASHYAVEVSLKVKSGSIWMGFLFTTLLPWAGSAQTPKELQTRAAASIEVCLKDYRKTRYARLYEVPLRKAKADLEASHAGFIRDGNHSEASHCLLNLGRMEFFNGQWDQAVGYFQRADSLALSSGDTLAQAQVHKAWAEAESQGRRDRVSGLMHAEKAERLAEGKGDADLIFGIKQVKASILIELKEFARAAIALDAAFRLEKKVKDLDLIILGYKERGNLALMESSKCMAQGEREDHQYCYDLQNTAQAAFSKAQALEKRLGYTGASQGSTNAMDLAAVMGAFHGIEKMGQDFQGMGMSYHPIKPSDVMILDPYSGPDPDSNQFPKDFDFFGVRKPDNAKGIKAEQGKSKEPFKDMLQQYFRLGTPLKKDSSFKVIHTFMLPFIEAERRNLPDEKTRINFMEANIGHYYAAIDFFLKRRDYPDAFKAMELCRSRTLADVMAGGQKTKLDDKAEKSLSLYRNRMAQLDVLYGSYYARAKRAPGTSPDSMEALDARIRALENEAEDIRASMGPDASTALDLLSSEPATLDRIQGIARKDSLEILEYLVRDDRVILWYIAGDSVHVRNIILPRYEISKKSNLLLRSLAPHSPGSKTPPASGPCLDEQTATELFLFLIQPVLPWIRGKRLVVIPHDILWDVPFQILLDPATRAYVGESFRISYMPNASLLTNRRKLPNLKGKALLAVANPAISTSMKEIETISLNYGKQSVLL
ncbi:MAG TPA: CHAT domain-containing protein, partial [Fibrobacteria bacterium]|nr:CHAT domain-containing protein [Fibrobacteria bacterium]